MRLAAIWRTFASAGTRPRRKRVIQRASPSFTASTWSAIFWLLCSTAASRRPATRFGSQWPAYWSRASLMVRSMGAAGFSSAICSCSFAVQPGGIRGVKNDIVEQMVEIRRGRCRCDARAPRDVHRQERHQLAHPIVSPSRCSGRLNFEAWNCSLVWIGCVGSNSRNS